MRLTWEGGTLGTARRQAVQAGLESPEGFRDERSLSLEAASDRRHWRRRRERTVILQSFFCSKSTGSPSLFMTLTLSLVSLYVASWYARARSKTQI